MRRALVIGLGQETLPLLQQDIPSLFGRNRQPYDLATLCLPLFGASAMDEDILRCILPLSLNGEALNDLYHQPEVRTWSAPNCVPNSVPDIRNRRD